MGWKKEYKAVGQSLAAGSKALGEWKVADMTIGLSYLAEKRAEEEKENPELRSKSLLSCEKVSSKDRLKKLEWACDLAEIAYIGQESVLRKLLLQEMDLTLVHAEVQSKFAVPAHYWAYNKDKKVCVFAVRGTASMKDALTDLDSIGEDLKLPTKGGDGFSTYKVHRGMLQSAKALCEKVSKQLQDLSQEGFEIFVVGHSLGAGTATLLSMLLKTKYDIDNLTCFAIATPPVADPSLCEASKAYITSLVCHDDIVCRLSVANIHRLNQELLELPWLSMVASDLTETKVGKMADYMGVKIGETKSRVTAAKTFQQASQYGKKAIGKVKPKIGSLTNFATDKMSKVKIGFGSLGRKKSSAQAKDEEAEAEAAALEGGAAPDASERDPLGDSDCTEVDLLPPGRLVYLSRTCGSNTNQEEEESEDESEDEDDDGDDSQSNLNLTASVQAYEVNQSWEGLNRIELSKTMLQDHYLTSYFENLKLAMGEPVEEPQVVLSTEMFKLEAGKKALIGLAEWKEREVSLLKLRRKHFVIQYIHSKGKKHKQVDLKGAHVSRMKSIMNERPFAFAIEGADQTVKLDPKSEEEMNAWLSALGTLLPLHE